jgi:hypothetical protein
MRSQRAFVTGMVLLVAASGASAQVTIDFDSLTPGSVVTNQYVHATFSSSAGNHNKAVFAGSGNVLFSGVDGGPLTGSADTYIDFLHPVNGLTFTAVQPNGAGVVATFNVYESGVLTASVPLTGLGGSGSKSVDLSAYQDVTRLEIVGIDPSPAENGIAWDEFSFTPKVLATIDFDGLQAGQAELDFDALAGGSVVTTQYAEASFSSSPGNHNKALFAGSGNVLVSGPVGGPLTGKEDTYVDFLHPVNGLKLRAIEPNGAGVVATFHVFESGVHTATLPLNGLGGPGSIVVDLGAYQDVTRLEIVGIDPSPSENGIAWDDLEFTPNFTVVTSQYSLARFSSSAGNHNGALSDGVGNALCSGPAGGPPNGIEDTYVDFLYPVDDLRFTAVEPNGAGVVATFRVFEDGVHTATVPLTGLGGPGSLLVDLSAYANVTRLEIVGIDPDPLEDGIGWDGFQFMPASQATIDFDDLAAGSVVTDQYLHAVFSSSSGNHNKALFAGAGNVLISGPVSGPVTGSADTYVDFFHPVLGLRFTAVQPNGAGVVARFRIFEDGVFSAEVPLEGLGGPGSKLVDLGSYRNVTRLEIVGIDPSPAENGIAWDDFSFVPITGPYVYCTAQVNSAGCTPAIAFSGTPTLAGGASFVLSAVNLIDDKLGILLHGGSAASQPMMGGLLCVGPPILRAGLLNSGGAPPCAGALALDFNAHMATKPLQFWPGKKIWAQFWSRDPAAAQGGNLTDAVAFVVGL